jgi:hypothetical protein
MVRDEREYVVRVVQDLRVKLRDEENMAERMKLQNLIKKFEKGIKEEYEKF